MPPGVSIKHSQKSRHMPRQNVIPYLQIHHSDRKTKVAVLMSSTSSSLRHYQIFGIMGDMQKRATGMKTSTMQGDDPATCGSFIKDGHLEEVWPVYED